VRRRGARLAALVAATALVAGCAATRTEPTPSASRAAAVGDVPESAPSGAVTPRAPRLVGAAAILALQVFTGDGPARPLRDVLGTTPAVVSIWASYCVPCRAEAPVLEQAAETWKGVDVRVVAVVGDLHDPKRVARLQKDWDIVTPTWWIAEDAEVQLDKLLPRGLPSTFFVKGETVVRHDHLLTDSSLAQLAQQILGVCVP